MRNARSRARSRTLEVKRLAWEGSGGGTTPVLRRHAVRAVPHRDCAVYFVEFLFASFSLFAVAFPFHRGHDSDVTGS